MNLQRVLGSGEILIALIVPCMQCLLWLFSGHYVALVKSQDHWLFFDDETVEPISEATVRTTFGSTQEYSSHMDHGYILMYEQEQEKLPTAVGGNS